MPTVEYPEQPERIIIVNHAQTSALLGWHSGADETEPVDVIVKGPDMWSVQKAIRLIEVAPKMYEALSDLIDAVYNPMIPAHGLKGAVEAAERAIAAACGGVLQRDALQRGR